MKDKIVSILLNEGYKQIIAEVTAMMLMEVKEPRVVDAIQNWVISGEEVFVEIGEFSTKKLKEELSLNYAAALLFLDWYAENPTEALESIKYNEI